jgi:hypothetical protein
MKPLAEFYSHPRMKGGRCAICGTDSPRGNGSFPVDHDHRTGRVRGLLCHPCNTGIGLLGDSSNQLLAAVAYLMQHADVLTEAANF